MIWTNAHLSNPQAVHACAESTNSGWKLIDGKYNIVWFEGAQMTQDIEQNISAIESLSEDDITNENNAVDVEDCGSDESDNETDSYVE